MTLVLYLNLNLGKESNEVILVVYSGNPDYIYERAIATPKFVSETYATLTMRMKPRE